MGAWVESLVMRVLGGHVDQMWTVLQFRIGGQLFLTKHETNLHIYVFTRFCFVRNRQESLSFRTGLTGLEQLEQIKIPAIAQPGHMISEA